jgi:hypothetical protein
MVYSSFGGSLLLIMVGAILRFAVTRKVSGIDIDLTGDILMATGGGVFLFGLIMLMTRGGPPGTGPPPPPPL